ncbi:MAG TPA: three-Cys-motif partner protein TcmP, partial [Rectinemataceae bacterium]|nr:three-Cys-motif partner protein TcmP [Rectinemataceae bacterium]
YTEEIRQKKNIALSAPCNGECDSILSDLLNNYEKRGTRFGPALAFLDQFGYSAVSMRLVGRLLAFPQCEVFSYLDYKDMNRWITDPSKAVSFDRTWGGDEWRHAIDLPEAERRAFLLDSYKAALKSRAKATYVSSFSMFDGHDRPLYWLIFSTNNLRGLEEMKRAMWSVDKMGSFKFSDNDTPGQLSLLNHGYDQNWLADELSSAFAGQTVTVAEVKEHVLVSTPCYLFREALKILETGRDPVVRVKNAPASRRPGTYPEEHLANIVVRFREAKLF